ncbi:S41 family peptidase [Paenibacillus sp. GYB004]|uniref:S41 family peptidase n=1 Tax=Paenibacillus sp. GYB004 TaxID=2994393 RepID=UPI002F9610CC
MGEAAMKVEDKMWIVSKVFQSIPLYFAHWEDASFPKEELDERYKELIAQAAAADTERQFSLQMIEFMAKLNNGHTNFSPKPSLYGAPIGVYALPFRGEWIVRDSSIEGLVPGDKVERVEGKTPDQWYCDLRRYIHPSNPESNKRQLFRALNLILPETFVLEAENREGQKKEWTLLRKQPSPSGAADGDRGTTGRVIGAEAGTRAGAGYIRIPSFGNPEFENRAMELVKEYADMERLIIDVRGNGGGSTPSKLTRALMNKPYRWYAEMTPHNVGIHTLQAAKGWANQYYDSYVLMRRPYQESDGGAYGGRVIILTDRGTGSAAEDFVLPFKDNGRAAVIGQSTFGSTGQPFYYEFANGMSFRISTKRAYFPDGSPFEGVGIAPDLAITPTREDLYENRDPVLAAALEID